jgi:Domain of unknown function (DUF3331)
MLSNRMMHDPWLETIRLLEANSIARPKDQNSVPNLRLQAAARRRTSAPTHGFRRPVTISVSERPTNSTAILEWRDPTSCCYGEQIWRSCVARRSGECALSGQPIHSGDEIYKPNRCKVAPANADAMILASALDSVIPTSKER